MAVYPFTPGGVQSKKTELYALSDALLQAQALSILNDFPAWVNLNFSLTALQETYLNNFSVQMKRHLASILSIGFSNRLSITLIAPTGYPTSPPPPMIGKWFHDRSTVVIRSQSGEVPVATGEIIFEITYD